MLCSPALPTPLHVQAYLQTPLERTPAPEMAGSRNVREVYRILICLRGWMRGTPASDSEAEVTGSATGRVGGKQYALGPCLLASRHPELEPPW